MADKKDIKEKTSKIYAVLPKLDDQRCGYKSCGEFARAVAEGKATCYGCVSGGPQVATNMCEIMGTKVPPEAIAQFAPSPGLYQPGLSEGISNIWNVVTVYEAPSHEVRPLDLAETLRRRPGLK